MDLFKGQESKMKKWNLYSSFCLVANNLETHRHLKNFDRQKWLQIILTLLNSKLQYKHPVKISEVPQHTMK